MLEGNKTPHRELSRACQLSVSSVVLVNISTSSAQQQSMREAELQFDIRAGQDQQKQGNLQSTQSTFYVAAYQEG